jgi:DNA-binding response OmpR family regulator
MLPDLDGHRFARRLREEKPAVSTVLMIGQGFAREAKARMNLGAHYLVAKPLSQAGIDREVKAMVRWALRRRGGGLPSAVPPTGD